MRHHLHILSLASSVALVLVASSAAAQEPPPPPPEAAPAPVDAEKDGARFRGGVALEGGGLIVPDGGSLGLGGVNGQIGVQINNLVGVYFVPTLDILFGSGSGVYLGSGVLVDFTMVDDMITVGAGPDLAVFAAIGSGSASGGAMYGGRLHFGYNAIVGKGDDGIRRKALTIGADLRLMVGPFATASATTASASTSAFAMAPTAFIAYQAF